ncbi:hypothetical protein VNO77_15088 [Canavalia gladiata]|uniref:Uncharacterized protein n=1 Tax=Canavalia gladiata TaxID=3824 RepID=A0AAN9QVP5_CANGL
MEASGSPASYSASAAFPARFVVYNNPLPSAFQKISSLADAISVRSLFSRNSHGSESDSQILQRCATNLYESDGDSNGGALCFNLAAFEIFADALQNLPSFRRGLLQSSDRIRES